MLHPTRLRTSAAILRKQMNDLPFYLRLIDRLALAGTGPMSAAQLVVGVCVDRRSTVRPPGHPALPSAATALASSRPCVER